MAPKKTIAELVKKRTKAGDPFFVGHVEHARVTLFFSEVRIDSAGHPVEVWQLTLEPTQHHPTHEIAPPADRRANGQRPATSSGA